MLRQKWKAIESCGSKLKLRSSQVSSDDVCAPLCRSAVAMVCRFRKTSVKPASVMNTFDPRSDSV